MAISRSRICFLVTLIIIFYSCSKTSDNKTDTPIKPTKDCKIIAASAVLKNGDTLAKYTFTYFADGRLASSTYKNDPYSYNTSYTYSGNSIYRVVDAGVNSSFDTITVNSAGLMLRDKEIIGAKVYTRDFTYDADNQLMTQTSQQGDVATYTFTNGDNTLFSQGAFQDTMVYDISKPAVTGNLDQFYQLLGEGAIYKKNKHLLISEQAGNKVTYAYEYNADGIISAITYGTQTNSATIRYTYECK